MFIAETDSTNNLLRDKYLDAENLFTVSAGFQTAGRGQQGNGWESERDKNLLFSTLLRDWHIPVSRQFILNQIVSLSLFHTVRMLLPGTLQRQLAVKWPNDLYFADRKLAGILIENIWQGSEVSRSIAGIGLNVNQTVFCSSAPNPVSLCQITGAEYECDSILQRFLLILRHYRRLLSGTEKNKANRNAESILDKEGERPEYADEDSLYQQIALEYMQVLYRREGMFLWEEREVSSVPSMPQMKRNNCQFLASIHTVLPTGELVLLTSDNHLRTFHFKQIRYVITSP